MTAPVPLNEEEIALIERVHSSRLLLRPFPSEAEDSREVLRLLATIRERDAQVERLRTVLQGLVDLYDRGSQVVYEPDANDEMERSVYPWDHYIDWNAVRAAVRPLDGPQK